MFKPMWMSLTNLLTSVDTFSVINHVCGLTYLLSE